MDEWDFTVEVLAIRLSNNYLHLLPSSHLAPVVFNLNDSFWHRNRPCFVILIQKVYVSQVGFDLKRNVLVLARISDVLLTSCTNFPNGFSRGLCIGNWNRNTVNLWATFAEFILFMPPNGTVGAKRYEWGTRNSRSSHQCESNIPSLLFFFPSLDSP